MSKSYNDKTPADSRQANEKSPVPAQGPNPYIKFIDSLNSDKIRLEEDRKQIQGHEALHLEQTREITQVEHRLAILELLKFQYENFINQQFEDPQVPSGSFYLDD